MCSVQNETHKDPSRHEIGSKTEILYFSSCLVAVEIVGVGAVRAAVTAATNLLIRFSRVRVRTVHNYTLAHWIATK